MRRSLFALLAACILAAPALAEDIPCGPVDKGQINIDGLLDDWDGVPALTVGGRSKDLSFDVRCNYDDAQLYLAVTVRDDYLVRTTQNRPAEDHVDIAVAAARSGEKVDRLTVYPGDAATSLPHKLKWSSGRTVKNVSASDSLQPDGWAIEVAISLRQLPEWSPGVAQVHLAVSVADCDSKAKPATEQELSTAPLSSVSGLGVIAFSAGGRSAFGAFLEDRHLTQRDVTFDRYARVLSKGKARVVAAGKNIAIVTDQYIYIELPVVESHDLKEVKLVDLAGDGRQAVLVRYVERAPSGSREVLAAYRADAEGLRRVFGVEVGKSDGKNRIEAKVSFVKKGRHGTDILVEPKPAVGWTVATYHEDPAEDVVPILLPWSGTKRERFTLDGDAMKRVE